MTPITSNPRNLDDDRWAKVLGSFPAPLYVTDALGRITFFNEAAADLWGRRPELGHDRWCGSWRIYNADGSPASPEACPMARALKNEPLTPGEELVIERPDGSRRCVVPHPEPLHDAQGNVAGAINLLVDVTEQRAAARAEALLAAIVESSDDAIVSKTLDGYITSWNHGAERIFGYTAAEAVGKHITMLIPRERLSEEDDILSKLRRGERIDHFETIRVAKDGRRLNISVTVSPVRDRSGRIIGASKVARDITERRRADQVQSLLAAIVESSDDAIISKTLEGSITSWNRGAERVFGYTAEEALGRHISLLIPPERLDEESHIVARIQKGERVDHFETVRVAKDGRRLDISLTVSPIRDHTGRIVGASKISRDVTERKRAAEALRRAERASEERFRLMADSAPALIWIAGPDKRSFWFNRPWLQFTGRTMERELGSGWMEGVHSDDLPGVITAYESAFEARKDFRAEFRLRRSDATHRWVLSHGVPLYGSRGEFAGYIVSCVDITDQVLARQTLQSQQSILEEAVKARTEELRQTHERLRLSERMASLGTLSAGLGHDMGNLLMPMRVRLETLQQATLSPELKAEVDAIRSSADYLQRLASGLRLMALDPSRIAEREHVELRSWWAEVAPILKNVLPRNAALTVDLPAEDLWVAMSRAALSQAVFNLVQNSGEALKSRPTSPDPPKVHISIQTDSGQVIISVRDNGPGMSPDVRAHCLEPFFTTKTRGISTGLGLVLVAGFVRDSGGTLAIDSEMGQGATFTITLPRVPNTVARPGSTTEGAAVVRVADPRMRAIISAELRALSFSILGENADAPADLAVLEARTADPSSLARARQSVVLGSPAAGPASVISIPERPRPDELRKALRRAAELARTPNGNSHRKALTP